MLFAGIDVGSLYTKAAVVRDGEVLGWSVIETGESSREAARTTLAEALSLAEARLEDLEAVVATGAGMREVHLGGSAGKGGAGNGTGNGAAVNGVVNGEVNGAGNGTGNGRPPVRHATPVLALARGARHLAPEATGVVDLGGESTHVVKLDADGHVQEFARNDKCAAGTGIFLDAMADLMKVPVPEMGPLSLTAKGTVEVSSTCVVFAESEVVSAVHRQTPREDILHGIHQSIATRVHGLVNRVGLDAPVAAVGGLALNVGIVTCLETLGGAPLVVPPEPRIVGAVGAALLASEGGGSVPEGAVP